jgi:flavin reductase (DIM6/NTAB) family NADH-FMN oxidoreductase RutF
LDVKLDVEKLSYGERHKLLGNIIVPRPIFLVSTLSESGNPNLAPYSLSNIICYTPAMVFLTPMRKNRGEKKDTLVNIEQTQEFVINMVTEDMAQQMTVASRAYPPEVNEFKMSGLTPIPSDLVKPPRVAESPFNLECRLTQVIPLGSPGEITADMILGVILRAHIADNYYNGGAVDTPSAHLIGRMGLGFYTRTRDLFKMGEN